VKSRIITRLGIAVVAAIVVSEAQAQPTGVPVRSATIPSGITWGAELGFGRARESDENSTALSAYATLGLGPVAGQLGLARTDIEAVGAGVVMFAAAELTMIGAPLVPLRVVWQAGFTRWLDRPGAIDADPTRVRAWRGWIGAGAALTIPAAVVSIKPWLAPRLEYFGKQPVDGVRFKPGLSGGVDLGFLNGFGLRVAYDSRLGWIDGRDHATGVSVGVSYTFR
jgi:hypothetical protein